MISESIEVECYSGSRLDERPRSVTIRGHKHAVARLLGESIEERDAVFGRKRTHHYRVLTQEGLVLQLFRTDDGCWFLSRS